MKMNRANIPLHSGIVAAMAMIVIVAAGLFVCESAYAFSSTDIKTDEGVVGGYIYFDEATGTITDCDRTVTEADIPEEINGITVKTIAGGAFRDVRNLSRITFPDSLHTIETNAVTNCVSLTEIMIPKGVADLDDNAFDDCFKLEYINVEEGNPCYYSQDGVVFINASSGKYLYIYPEGSIRTEYTIPDGIVGIVNNAFYRQPYLETVIMPDSITGIGQAAFADCKKLKKVVLSDNLKRINMYAFEGCYMLESIVLPETMTAISSRVFANCSNLKNIVIPSSVETIVENAFVSCPNVVIYGEYGSCAEEYAGANNLQFISSSGLKISQTINGSSSITKTYGCNPFTLDLSAKTALTYESSNTDVATVSAEGVVTVRGGGTATITVTAAETEKYKSTEKKITVVVGKAPQTISGSTSFTKTYGCSAFSLGASAHTGLTYKSSNTDVATVSAKGIVTVKKSGKATITVTATEGKNYKSVAKNVTVTVGKASQTISGKTTFSKAYGNSAFYLGAAAKTGMTYRSSNTGVAVVSSSGKVTVKGVGTATITISAEETEKYKAAAKKVTVTVGKASQTITGKTSFSKTYGCGSFSLGAAAKTGLTYKSSNAKIAAVSSSGKVTFKNPGKATITVTAKSTSQYKSAVKKVIVSSTLKKPALTVKAYSGKKIKLSWSQVPGASGYKVYIYDAKTKKYVCRLTKSAKVKSVMHKGLSANKTYYYKVRAYRAVDGKNIYSAYSQSKKAKAKK